jgi:hypothetical protein
VKGCGDLLSGEPLANKENTAFDPALLAHGTPAPRCLCHSVSRLSRIRPVGEGLKVQFVDSKWIRDQVPSSLAGFERDNHPVLTAPASRIEAFLNDADPLTTRVL